MRMGIPMIGLKKHILSIGLLCIFGCDVNTSAYTLYKLDAHDNTQRITVEKFTAGKTEEENLAACHKFRTDLLTKEQESLGEDQPTDKYWCEKGGA